MKLDCGNDVLLHRRRHFGLWRHSGNLFCACARRINYVNSHFQHGGCVGRTGRGVAGYGVYGYGLQKDEAKSGSGNSYVNDALKIYFKI